MVEYNRYTNCIFKPLKGKYFGKKCFLSFLIPSTVRHLCSNNERDAFFRCVPSGAHFFIFGGKDRVDIYRIAFIGHREIYGHYRLEDEIERIVRDKLYEKEYVEFYVGRNGDFDISVASAIKRAQNAVGHHNSCLILLQPYPMKDDEYYEKFYDEVQYPVDFKTITKRNRWMVENTELLIAFVEEGRKGGALTTLKYAEKQGVEIINLAIRDE